MPTVRVDVAWLLWLLGGPVHGLHLLYCDQLNRWILHVTTFGAVGLLDGSKVYGYVALANDRRRAVPTEMSLKLGPTVAALSMLLIAWWSVLLEKASSLLSDTPYASSVIFTLVRPLLVPCAVLTVSSAWEGSVGILPAEGHYVAITLQNIILFESIEWIRVIGRSSSSMDHIFDPMSPVYLGLVVSVAIMKCRRDERSLVRRRANIAEQVLLISTAAFGSAAALLGIITTARWVPATLHVEGIEWTTPLNAIRTILRENLN